jgi:hypothetical protein
MFIPNKNNLINLNIFQNDENNQKNLKILN